MSSAAIRDEILQRLEHLPEASQRQVLNLVRRLPTADPEGTPVENLFAFSGTLDDESAREIEAAIEEGCELTGDRHFAEIEGLPIESW